MVVVASRKGRKLWSGEIPIETRTALQEEARESGIPQWKIVDQAVRMYLGLDEGSTEAALERKLEELDSKLDQVDEQAEQLQREREELREQKDLLRDQLGEIREKKASYKEQLDEILEDLLENPNKNVNAYMSEMKQAAIDEYGRDTKDNLDRVRADLQERRDSRDLDIEDYRFKRTATPSSGPSTATADGGNDKPDMRILSESEDENE